MPDNCRLTEAEQSRFTRNLVRDFSRVIVFLGARSADLAKMLDDIPGHLREIARNLSASPRLRAGFSDLSHALAGVAPGVRAEFEEAIEDLITHVVAPGLFGTPERPLPPSRFASLLEYRMGSAVRGIARTYAADIRASGLGPSAAELLESRVIGALAEAFPCAAIAEEIDWRVDAHAEPPPRAVPAPAPAPPRAVPQMQQAPPPRKGRLKSLLNTVREAGETLTARLIESIVAKTTLQLRVPASQVHFEVHPTPPLDDLIVKMAPEPSPPAPLDQLQFTASCPPKLQPRETCIVDVFAHLPEQRAEVVERARESNPDVQIAIRTTDATTLVAKGSTLSVRMVMPDCAIDPFENIIVWNGRIGAASLTLTVAENATPGPRVGYVRIYCGGFAIGEIPMRISIAATSSGREPFPDQYRAFRKAFASYSSKDLEEVVRRIQGIQKGLPNLEIFFDRRSLRSGQYWEPELWRHMDESQVMYLFWSQNALESKEVEKEWRRGLSLHGLDFIDPCPLVDPSVAKPPPELTSKHFNDWTLIYLSHPAPPSEPRR